MIFKRAIGLAFAGFCAAALLLSSACKRQDSTSGSGNTGARGGRSAGSGAGSGRGANSGGKTASARFASRPRGRVRGEGAAIEFEVAAATDVAVRILDRDGRVLRHLAAGVLGEKAPKPLKAGSLKQSLYWDGTDDSGRPVPAGTYRAEVCLGLSPRLDTFLGVDRYNAGRVHGLAVRSDSSLVVMAGMGRDSRGGCFRVYGSRGKYLRTLMPRSGGLPLERVKPLGEVVLDGGEHFPLTLFPNYGSRYYQTPMIAPNGDLIFVNGQFRGHREGKRFHSPERAARTPRQLLRMAPDGGASKEGSQGPVLGKAFNRQVLYLALAPGGENVYVSGAGHAVFKVKWGADEKPGAFAGTPGKAGSGADGLKNPCGVATDSKGRVYVADRGNHRVACFDSSGKLLSELKVEWPRQLVVHPENGTLYLTAGFKRQRLLKFESMAAGKPAVEVKLHSSWPVLALDHRAEKPVLYVGNVQLRRGDGPAELAVVRMIDEGERLVDSGRVTGGNEPFQPFLTGVDRIRELVYGTASMFADYVRWDGRSGRREKVTMPLDPKANGISEMTAGIHGTIAFHVASEFGRIDRHLLPDHFDRSGTFIARIKGDDCPRSNYDRGACVGPDGTLYHIHERGGYGKPMRVRALYPDGTVKRDSLIVFESRAAAGIRVDREGNIYVLEHLKPVDKPVPDAFAGKVKIERHNPFVYNYGSVLKFSPQGGRVRELSRKAPEKRDLEPGELQFTTAEGRGDFVTEGALWSWYGVSMIQPALDRSAYSPYNCMCWAPRFDLDDFDRVFVPDQLRCRIVVLDSSGNFVTAFGRYGNADDRGPGVPFADPRTVVVSRGAAYVGDMANHQIVRVKLDYAVRASCKVSVPRRTLAEISAELAERGEIVARRRVVRLLNAEVRVREVREEAHKVSPALAGAVDWRELERTVVRKSVRALPGADDARAALVVAAARQVRDWPEEEARALLGSYMKSRNPKLRLSVAWALCGGRLGELGREILREALKDDDQKVRVAAAYALLDRDDPTGLDRIFEGTFAGDPDVKKLAETAVLKKVLVSDPSHPLAGKIDGKSLVPRYRMDDSAVDALGRLLVRGSAKAPKGPRPNWYVRRAALFLLGLSDSMKAIPPLLAALRLPEKQRNLNRVIAGLGRLRSRQAVPDILKYLRRGRSTLWGTEAYNGDRAEYYAARALGQIAAPESVGPVIDLLDSDKKEVRPLARRALTEIFAAGVPDDGCLIPRGGKLVQVRVDQLPSAGELKSAWQAFWKVNSDRYAWNPDARELKKRKAK